jgi:prepilin-type N-terminal cleavage/methylation domain-containing protein
MENRRQMFMPGNTEAVISRRGKVRESGMTLLELMVAMAVLAVGMLGSMLLILAGMQTNSRNRTDTSAIVLDQEIIEKFSTLKQYPKGTYVTIYDCAVTSGGEAHQASVTQAAGPAGAGATLHTSSTAPTADKVGDIDWTQATPALATSTVQGYAMRYRTCSGDIYEVRWNVMEVSPNPNSRISLLTVSSRQIAAQAAQTANARNQAILYAQPTTLKTLIEN